MTEDVELLEHLAILELRPGDKLVLTHPDELTVEQYEYIRAQLKAVLPDHDPIILSGGLQIGALRGP